MSKIKPTVCYIGLGSNLDNPTLQLEQSINALHTVDNINVLKISSFYKTKPVGFLEQPDFINAVLKLSTVLSATVLMQTLLKIELNHKRKRDKNKNMPRTLDLDLLFFGNKKIANKNLTVPHPRARERAFVLVPLYEISPKFVRKFLGSVDFINKFKLNDEFKLSPSN